MAQNSNLMIGNEWTVDTYMRKFDGARFDFVKNPETGKLFFACGYLPNGKRNIGSIGQKAAEKIRSSSYQMSDFKVAQLTDVTTGVTWPCLMLDSRTNVIGGFSL